MIKEIQANNYYNNPTTFKIVWQTFHLGYSFAVGIDENEPNEFSIFYVWNVGDDDCYMVLDTGFLDVYKKYGYSVPEKVRKVMTEYITNDLTRRLKEGRITMEQIERMAR